jgi:DNA polymerase III delta prime subunit
MTILKKLIKTQKIPHLIFYSHDHYENINCLRKFLSELFPGENNAKCIKQEYKVNSKLIEIPFFISKYHIELSVNDLGYHSRIILPEFIKDIAQTKNIITNSQKIIVIHHVQNLDKQTQYMLRCSFENNIGNCRFILLTDNINNLIEPLQSRCILIKNQSDDIYIDKRIFTFMDSIESLTFEQINGILYTYMAKNISYTSILQYIMQWLLEQDKFSNEFKLKIINKITYYDSIMNISTREFIHMQSFIADYLYLIQE